MKKVFVILFMAMLFATPTTCGTTIDASNCGANWTVISGNSLMVSVLLTNGIGDNPKASCDLEFLISGSGTTPTFQAIDLLAASAIFLGGTQGPARGLGTADVYRHVDIDPATSNQGLLASVTINTIGVTPGIYNLTPVLDAGGMWTGCELVDANGNPIAFNRQAGTITVVPEPSSLVLITIVGGALLVFRVWPDRKVTTSRGIPG
jgi:hypothetical protein